MELGIVKASEALETPSATMLIVEVSPTAVSLNVLPSHPLALPVEVVVSVAATPMSYTAIELT